MHWVYGEGARERVGTDLFMALWGIPFQIVGNYMFGDAFW